MREKRQQRETMIPRVANHKVVAARRKALQYTAQRKAKIAFPPPATATAVAAAQRIDGREGREHR